ncbi:MAG: mobile mystery protein B [Acidimicrobiia bacterium]
MSDPLLPIGDGHSELTDEDSDGLLPSYIATRGELNDAEQRNIAAATLRRKSPTIEELLDDRYLRQLHEAMFGQVWKWAGTYRLRETNVGVEPDQIAVEVRNLVKDALAWIEFETFGSDELALRFHHRLVWIHPFRNGNGRHGRVCADALVQALGEPTFSWGARLAVETEQLRDQYLRALRSADAGEITLLMEFARS